MQHLDLKSQFNAFSEKKENIFFRFFNFFKRHRIISFGIIILIISVFLIYFAAQVSGLSYIWTQTDWSGGQSAEYPRHDNYQNGWTKWSSNEGNLNTGSSITIPTSATIPTSTAVLSSAREDVVAVYDATTSKAFIIGGYSQDAVSHDPTFYTTISQYDPIADTATVTGGALLIELRGHSADIASTYDGKIYIFGGYDNTNGRFNYDIYSFDPSATSSNAADTGYNLPSSIGRQYAPAVYASNVSKFYIFGGYYLDGSNNPQYLNTIVEFNPATGAVSNTSVGLPVALKGASAAYYPVDGKIYIFGGYDSSEADYTNKIYVFDPQSPNSGASELVGVTLPTKRAYTSAAYYQSMGAGTIQKIMIFGGYYLNGDASVYLDTVVNFDVTSATTQTETLDRTLRGTGAIFCSDNSTIYVFGGYSDSASAFSDVIHKYRLYTAYPLVSSAYHTTDTTTVLSSLKWTESLNTDTDILFQIRTASNTDNGTPLDFSDDSPSVWTDWCGPDNGGEGCSTTTYFTDYTGEPIDAIFKDGIDDVWVQYRLYMITDSLNNTPTLEEVQITYVVNTEPSITSVSASQGTDGIVTVTYDFDENEEATTTIYLLYDLGVTLNAEQAIDATSITITGTNASYLNATGTIQIEDEMMTYSNKDGSTISGITRSANNTLFYKKAHAASQTVWVLAGAATGDVGSVATGTSKSISWDADSDVSGLWASNDTVKVRVVANDGNAARQVGSADSSTFEFDTKDPVVGTPTGGGSGMNINANATTTVYGDDKAKDIAVTLNLSATDNTDLYFMASNDGVFDTEEWQAYATSASWNLNAYCAEQENGCEKTVYLKFKDAHGNETSTYNDTVTLDNNAPAVPSHMYIQDVSNIETGEYRIFTTWDKATESDWVRYEIFRSTDGIDFAAYATITDKDLNYLLDQELASSTYYYKARSVDDIINNSDYSSTVSLTAGGNPADYAPPTISSVSDGTPTINSVLITWSTEEISSSNVYYSITSTVPDGSPSQGVSGYDDSHSVTLRGLDSSTTYYYYARSCDASDNCSNSSIGDFITATPDSSGPEISSVSASGLKENSATITWTTNEAADSFVEFSTSTGFITGTLQGKFVFETSHSVTLSGLTSETTYYYKVRSADSSGNVTVSSEYSFSTIVSSADVTPPTISNIASSNLAYNTATVTWDTNEESSSFVEFGPTTSYGRIYGQEDLVQSHTVNLPHDLNPATTYHYRARSKDVAGNEGMSSDSTFITSADPNDVAAPVISLVDVGDPSKDQITITWTTDEEADSYIGYSLATTTYNLEQGNPTMATSHSVTLVGLVPNSTYYARVKSTDPSGNIAIDNNSGSGYSFTTLAASSNPPTISNIQFSNVTHNAATIAWTTDISSTSFVEYGQDTSYGYSQGSFTLTTSHSVSLTGLLSEATYHFRVRSSNSEGVEAVSQDYTFTTETAPDITPPVISSVQAVNIDMDSADITWTTGEEANSIIEYGTSTENLNYLAGDEGTYVTSHTVSLINLTVDTTYYYQVKSRDRAGNLETDDNSGTYYNFTTVADVTAPVISNVTVPVKDRNSATVTWDTDEDATSQVIYSLNLDMSDSSETTQVLDLRKEHSVLLSSLVAETTYYFYVRSQDAYNNEATSSVGSFDTTTAKEDVVAPVISAVATSSITLSGATITWTTDENSDSIVDYGTTVGLGQLAGNTSDATTTHSVSLTSLTSDTLYYFQVRSQDSSGNTATDNNGGNYYTFTTVADGTNPVISNVDAPVIDRNSATVTWDTDEDATSQVEYSTSPELSESISTTLVTDLRKEHSVILSSLTSSTTYYYRVKSKDAANNLTTSSIYNFTTAQAKADSTAPTISDVATSSITLSGATITWTTTENSDSIVDYGLTTALGSMTGNIDDSTTSHSISLTGLTQNTKYYFQVRSADSSGNRKTDNNGGDYYSFTTTADTTDPVISAIQASVVDRNSANITWTTDEAGTSQVEYATSSDLSGSSSTTLVTDLTLQHSVVISGLTANTKYYYRVKSKDAADNEGVSNIYDFTTATSKEDSAGPDISSVTISNISLTGATVTWTTSEAANSIVDYGTSISLGILAGDINELVTSHTVSLIDLSQNTTYYLQVRSQDEAGNTTTDNNGGDYYSFTTTADNTAPTITLGTPVVDRNSATVVWTTNEAGTSQVEYATSSDLSGSSSTTLVTDLTLQHSVVISGLTDNTKYYYRVKSKDAADNEGVSAIANFTTAQAKADSTAPAITGVTVSNITGTSARITWTTGESSNSIVDYGTTISLGLMAGNIDDAVTSHTVNLTGLSEGTTYYFQVRSQDASGNSTPDNNNGDYYSFTTIADTAAPLISNVTIPLITDDSAIIVWTTDENSSSRVAYGVSDSFGSLSDEDTTLTKVHAITIDNLSAQTQYYIKVISEDAAENTSEDDNNGEGYSFRTTTASSVVVIGGGGGGGAAAEVDVDGPNITGISTADVQADSIKIRWTTNENASQLVEYGFTNEYGYMAGSYEIGGSGHEVELKELFPDTVYSFRVISLDSKGNMSRSINDVFRTAQGVGGPENQESIVNTVLGMIQKINNPYDINQVSKALQETAEKKIQPPIIAGELPKIEPYEDSARISWITDKESNSIVAYATADEYNINAPEPYKNIVGNTDESTTFHSVDLTGLKSSTMYHVQVRSKMSIGPEAKSLDITFFTKSVNLEISNFRITKIENNDVEFGWDTNVPSNAIIEYTDFESGKTLSQGDPNFVKRHKLVLEKLKQNIT
ncbi:MAG: fibronectin type III domain-containing protein, partial [Candidatus Pacebacteria bacterium]|nr:fibronectin type III domain-containing protein [Candidatus Paceibacterota bacterium]